MSHLPGPWHYVYGAVWTTPNGPDDDRCACIAQRASGPHCPILPTVRDANLLLCSLAPELATSLTECRDLLMEVLRTIADNDTADNIGETTARADTLLARIK